MSIAPSFCSPSAQQFADCVEIEAGHRQAGSKRVARVVPSERFNARLLEYAQPGPSDVVQLLTVCTRKDQAVDCLGIGAPVARCGGDAQYAPQASISGRLRSSRSVRLYAASVSSEI